MTFTATANAKINLLLSVGEADASGKHQIETVMQSVSLADTVLFTPKEEGGLRLLCDEEALSGTDNIAAEAVRAYENATGCRVNGDLVIRKRIPVASGLGGGSSDAAATLMLINRVYRRLTVDDLTPIAASLGADVPFFLIGGTALCTHYGEEVAPVHPCPPCTVVIAKPCGKRSTASMYRMIDAVDLPPFAPATDTMCRALRTGSLAKVASSTSNDFEYVWHNDRMDGVRTTMEKSGALAARLSGSGSAVYGLFDSHDKAERCFSALQFAGIEAWICQPTYSGVVID